MNYLKKLKLTAFILRLIVVLSVLMIIGTFGIYYYGSITLPTAIFRAIGFGLLAFICGSAECKVTSLRREYIRKIHSNRNKTNRL